ncbi:MAG: helix-turn-helix domain-containing protein [Chloroflexia bacterium]
MDVQVLWQQAREVWEAIYALYRPVVDRLSVECGPAWGILVAALTFEPETTTPERLQVRIPYTAAALYRARLEELAGRGLLVEVGHREYRLTEDARQRLLRAVEEMRARMDQADPLPPAEGARLAGLLGRLARSALEAPPPPEPWSIRLSWKLMPPERPPLPYIEQAISCLNAYRDDAHLAAWHPSGVSAAALEALTLLWRGQADSLETLFARLAYRGHSPPAYAEALAELRARGWLEGPDEAPRLTAAGCAFREQVEADTDRYFFAPWSGLEAAEQEEMGRLLLRLRDGLKGRPA